MTATLTEARDEIHDAFFAVWDVDTPAVNGGSAPQVSVEGRAFTTPAAAAWASIRVRQTAGVQATLSGGLASPSKTRFRKSGTVIVSIYTPLEAGTDTKLAETLATIAASAFQGKATPSQVWFRDVVSSEQGVDGPWFVIIVSASFEYDELA